MYQLQKKNKSLIVRIAIFIFCLSLSVELLRVVFRKPSLQESLVASANEINKHCPIVVDSTTVLANAMALAGNQFIFNYTLVHLNKIDFDTVYFKNAMQAQLVNVITTNPSLKTMREDGIIFTARYSDSSLNYLCSITVGPWNYK